MSAAVTKSFRVVPKTTEAISHYANKQRVSMSKALEILIQLGNYYLEEQQLEKELDELSGNKKWMKCNEDWAMLSLNNHE